uniref:Uncharacterized protein n=1 Tax=Anguilla anguilla TaxID=7936 RepID=A0A0E9SWZ9_ANGAN
MMLSTKCPYLTIYASAVKKLRSLGGHTAYGYCCYIPPLKQAVWKVPKSIAIFRDHIFVNS